MKLYAFGSAIALLLTSGAAIADVYKFDPGHTEIRFYYNHAGLSEQSGQWKIIGGEVDFDPNNVEATTANITIDASSVDTGVTALDDHLKTADFFEVDTYPEITFTSTGVTQTSDKSVTLTGDLTVKDVTNPVTLELTLNHIGEHPLGGFFDYYQGEWIGVSGTGDILRSDFGVGMFAPITSDEVRLEISAEMRKGGWE